MKNILIAGVVILIVAGIIALYIHRREEVFEGQVVDKDIIENVNNSMPMNNQPGFHIGGPIGVNNVTHTYVVKVQTAEGKTKTWNVSEGKYEIIKIGDHVSKPKGTTELQLVSSTSSQNPVSTDGAPPQSPPTSTITN